MEEKIVEVEDIVKVIGRGLVIVVKIPYSDGDPVIGTDMTDCRTGNAHKLISFGGMMTLMTHPQRKDTIELRVEHPEEIEVGDKMKVWLRARESN